MTAHRTLDFIQNHVYACSRDYALFGGASYGCLPCFFVYPIIAHMWFSDEVHEANTNEDPQNPGRTRRVSPY